MERAHTFGVILGTAFLVAALLETRMLYFHLSIRLTRTTPSVETLLLVRTVSSLVAVTVTLAVAYHLGRTGAVDGPKTVVLRFAAAIVVAELSMVALWSLTTSIRFSPSFGVVAFGNALRSGVPFVLAAVAGVPLGAIAESDDTAAADDAEAATDDVDWTDVSSIVAFLASRVQRYAKDGSRRTWAPLLGAALLAAAIWLVPFLDVVGPDSVLRSIPFSTVLRIVALGGVVGAAYLVGETGEIERPGAAVVQLLVVAVVAKFAMVAVMQYHVAGGLTAYIWEAFTYTTEFVLHVVIAGMAGLPLGAMYGRGATPDTAAETDSETVAAGDN